MENLNFRVPNKFTPKVEESEVTTWKDPYTRQIRAEEQKLYKHLLHWAQVESPSRLIERFHSLFIDGTGYPDTEIVMLLDQIISSKQAEQDFKFVLNRCCHILINRWQMNPQQQIAIPELVTLFENTSTKVGKHSYRSKSVRRLQELIELFIESEQYVTLRRLSQVMSKTAELKNEAKVKPLGTLIRRYPYLYEHCLLSEDSTYEHQQNIRQIQTQAQAQFEIGLSQYVTYQVRRSHLAKKQAESPTKLIIPPVKNPTLLSDGELFGAIKQYAGRVEGSYTYRDLAQSFLTHSSKTPSFRAFKNDLYAYLITSIEPEYGKRQFNKKFQAHLQNILSHNDSQQVNEFLLIRTCSHLLNFLVVNSTQQPQHFIFIDLVANLGINITVGLLLKILLLCRKVKPYLEKRFSILFNHYESDSGAAVMWLIQSLENLNVALSIHFGSVDLSYLNQLR